VKTRRCPFPDKDQLTKAAARSRALHLNRRAFDGARVKAYRCPAGGHFHVGHPVRPPRRWRAR
jgi:hypothetical protein